MVLPASAAVPANMPIAGRSGDGELALVRNDVHRPRAFTTTRWEWNADDDAMSPKVTMPFVKAWPADPRIVNAVMFVPNRESRNTIGPSDRPARK